MYLQLKLCKIGDGVGLILPEEALAHLKVKEGDSLSVTEEAGGSLRVSHHDEVEEVQRQLAIARDIMRRYDYTFRELAK